MTCSDSMTHHGQMGRREQKGLFSQVGGTLSQVFMMCMALRFDVDLIRAAKRVISKGEGSPM